MSEFELSTLALLVLLLLVLAAYSYWQIARVHRRQKALQADYDDEAEWFEPPLVAPIEMFEDDDDAAPSNPSKTSDDIEDGRTPAAYEPVFVGRSTVVGDASDGKRSEHATADHSLDNVHYHLASEATASPVEKNVNAARDGHRADTDAAHTDSADSAEPVPAVTMVQESFLDDDSTPAAAAIVSPVQTQPKFTQNPTPQPTQPTQSTQSTQPTQPAAKIAAATYAVEDTSEQASLAVFEPLIRFSTWVSTTYPAPIHAIDGVIDLVVPQPKQTKDIEHALYDLQLDTGLPLRLYGRRAGLLNSEFEWEALSAGVLYSGLRLTLQLANRDEYAQPPLLQDWFVLAERLAKRLAAQVHAMPDPAALASYAMYLHDLSKRLSASLVVQLHKKQGLWPAYEVHQQMTQWGIHLSEHGQYVAKTEDGRAIYSVVNDLGNARAQDFYRDQLSTMHVNTLSFCVDLARVPAEYLPLQRLSHDMRQLASALDAQWLNRNGTVLQPDVLFAHADAHVPEYLAQLQQLGVPAGSQLMRRLLHGQG